MSRIFYLTGDTHVDVDRFVIANQVKKDDILIWDTLVGPRYWLWGTYDNYLQLVIPENVTERHEDALQYFSEAINQQISVTFTFYPHNKAISKRLSYIDDRVTLIDINFGKKYATFLRVKYGDNRVCCIQNNFPKLWDQFDQQNFDAVSKVIIDAIDAALAPTTELLFITSVGMSVIWNVLCKNHDSIDKVEFVQPYKLIVVKSKNIHKKLAYAQHVNIYRVKCQWKLRHLAVRDILDVFVNKDKIAVLYHCIGHLDSLYVKHEPGYYVERANLSVTTTKVHNYILDLALVLCKLFEPYVVLEIISWLPTISCIQRYKKIAILENVKQYIRSRNAIKDSISMRTRSKTAIENKAT